MQPSRRAFLLGRRPVQTPWATFLQRLALRCQGTVRDQGGLPGQAPRAVLAPLREADVVHARALCAEYGVVLALADAEGPFAPAAGALLRVDPGRLAGLARLAGAAPRWRAQPGVPLAALAQAGLRQFDGLPGAMTLAQWLAAPAPWAAGDCAASGVLGVDLLLADGVEESLGPFGADDVQPLRSATVQRLVPALFQLAGGELAAACRGADRWQARYRLDALAPRAPAGVNLAHLLLGHGGTLAWVRSVTLAAAPAPGSARAESGEGGAWPSHAIALQARIKALFDPHGRFPALAAGPDGDNL
ncbi:MAG: FAD-binding protein [Achromobacter sp.]|uniref:FAD-binding protein n=1 Tax=Achromobacter sp. TaxID=134375 RepID=UPI003D01D3FE